MPSACDITFDHSNGVYNSGEDLNGNIKLRVGSNKSIRGIHITIEGYAKVHWTESESYTRDGKTHTRRVSYNGREQYLFSRTYVLGSENHNSFDLASGDYNYSFYSPLPSELPTSTWEEYGHVRYEVTLTIDRPFRFDNVFKQAFTVIHNLDLNIDPSYRLGQSMSDTAFNCCCCFACCCGGSGEIRTECKIPQSGYVPGQTLNYTLCVFNESNSDILGISAELIKEINFRSDTPRTKYKTIKQVLIEKPIRLSVLRLTKKEYYDTIEIPTTSPTVSMDHQISIQYYFKVKVGGGACDTDMKINLPITIGSFPITNALTNLQPVIPGHNDNIISTQPLRPSAPLEDSPTNDKPPGYDSFVPPTYEETVKTKDLKRIPTVEGDVVHMEGPYEPKYPVYNNYVSPSAPSRFVEDSSTIGWHLGRNYDRSISVDAPVEHKWLQTNCRRIRAILPPGAFLAGHDHGDEMYIGRAEHKGDILPAKVIPKKGAAYVSWGGGEHFKQHFEILLGNQFIWVPSRNGECPPHAMYSGNSKQNEKLYIARAFYDGTQAIGKVHPSHGCCYIPYNGSEKSVKEYEVLVLPGS